MASVRRRTAYPWGTTPPRQRLRVVRDKAGGALEDAGSPGFGEVTLRVSAAVQATRPLVDALRYLSGAGLRSSPGCEPFAGDDVRVSLDRVNRSVNDLAAASVLELSDRYREFSEAVTALLAVADEALRRGIARPSEDRADDGWTVFKR